MKKELEDLKKFGKFVADCLIKSMYYGVIIAYLIMQIGCASKIPSAEESIKKANRSVSYGANQNKLIASHTSALFY